MSQEGLRSGQAAAAAGVNIQTLRYYERRGLLEEPSRTLGGHRLYTQQAVTTLRIIKAAQRLGFTLQEIEELLGIGHHRHDRGAGLPARAAGKLIEVETKIADLTIIRDTLRAALTAGCQDLAVCSATPGCPLPFAELAQPATCS